MAKKVPLERLGDEIMKILEEYKDEVEVNSSTVVRKVTQAGVKALKASSKGAFGGTGKYAGGWTSQFETGRMSTQGTIYNAATPGLPHLLEHGHAKRGGGRVAGRSHIAPVEQKLIQDFENKLRSDL